MTFYAIKLNPSQELKLAKAGDSLLGPGGPLSLDKQSGRVRQKVQAGQAIFLRPLLCVLPQDFSQEEFLSIQKFEIFAPLSMSASTSAAAAPTADPRAPACFWARIATRARVLIAPIPFALDYSLAKDFSLEKVFALAADLADSFGFAAGAGPADGADGGLLAGQKFLFCPSSFKICRAQATKNEWRLYDEAWKKLKI